MIKARDIRFSLELPLLLAFSLPRSSFQHELIGLMVADVLLVTISLEALLLSVTVQYSQFTSAHPMRHFSENSQACCKCTSNHNIV